MTANCVTIRHKKAKKWLIELCATGTITLFGHDFPNQIQDDDMLK